MATYNIEDIGGEAKARYYKQLKDVDLDCCPYQIASHSWKNNPTKWPDLEFPDTYVYLIETPGVFIRESMKNRKSMKYTTNLSMVGGEQFITIKKLDQSPSYPFPSQIYQLTEM